MQHQGHHSLSFVVVSLLLTKTTDLFSSAPNSENANSNSLFPPFLQLVVTWWEIHPVLDQENQKPTVVESDSIYNRKQTYF